MSGGNGKPKFAMYWAASCGGCEIAVLNIGEKILDVDANFEVVFWPVAMDAKYKDVEAMADGEILLTLFNGGIRNQENEELAHLLRRKSQILVAFGSCATKAASPAWRTCLRPSKYSTPYMRPPQQKTRTTSARSPRRRCPKAPSTYRRSSPCCAPWTRWSMWTTTCPAARRSRTRSRR